MEGEKREHWMRLCVEAADGQDSKRLLELISEIDRLLHEKEMRLKAAALFGPMLVTKFSLVAPAGRRCQKPSGRDFYLYVDGFSEITKTIEYSTLSN